MKNAPISIIEQKKLLVRSKDNYDHVQCLSNTSWFKTPEWEQYPRILWIAFLASNNLGTNMNNYYGIKQFAISRGLTSQCVSTEMYWPKKSKLWEIKEKAPNSQQNRRISPIYLNTISCCWRRRGTRRHRNLCKNVFFFQ